MKKLLTILLVVCFCAPVYAGGTMYLKGTDTFMISHGVPDSAGESYTPADSVEITVMFQDATESMAATWFNNADAQAVLSNGKLYFYDAWTDMNGSDSLGTYTVTANWYDGSGAALPFEETYTVIQVTDNIEAIAKEASLFDPTTDLVVADDTMSTGDSVGTKENQTSILAYFDTLIYVGPRGLGVYLDSAAGNANTVLGTDGTSKNPVSTIAAAKTLATALGYNRYYFINASTFNDAATDMPSSHQNWEFIGIGNSNAVAFGTQRVDESRFENMDLSGAMHGSGGNVLYTNCTLGYITQNFNGHAFNCLLADTIVVKAGVDIEFVRCQSDVGGNRTPTIDLSGGSSIVQLRGYSGGIRIMNGSSNDTISVEADGQVIISANNTSLTVTLRGMMSITDSGTTTSMTKDAVFTRAEADSWVWANADTAQPDSSELGVWLVNNLSGAASGLDTLSTAFVLRLVDEINSYAFYATKGAVGGTPGLTGFSSAALTEATNDHWKDNMFAMFTGTRAGQGARITAFTPATDSITFTPALAGLPSPGDSFFVFTLISESGSASGVDSTVLSNVLHRIAHGTPVGSGSDSSTLAQRDVDVHNMQAGVITTGDFATGAITADAIAPNAIGASELATDAIGSDEFADRTLTLAKFDTAAVAAFYAFGIWLDDAASNTNTTVGVDGTIANPVSTLAAARILADSMGLQKYYLINNSSFTLAATYEDWDFVGVGESNEINFGDQDIDNSHFEHLMVAGIQGGTGLIWLNECYLNAADSLECVARNSWFSDTVSVRVATNIIFDNCFSAIPGNNTPGIDFNSAGGTISVNMRHYSGGLALFNMTSNHTISYESDGQLVIDASCTSANVTARGNMTITDNGTTTNLTSDAVFNTSQAVGSVTGAVGSVAGNVDGSVASVTAVVVASDTVATGDTLAVKKDSLIYQGGAASVTEASIWNYDGIADFKDSTGNDQAGQFLFNVGVDNVGFALPTLHMKLGLYSGAAGDDNNVKDDIDAVSVSGTTPAAVWNYDISDFIDTTSNIRAGQYLAGVGINDIGQSIATLHMKVGDYSGAAGSNVEDDFDSLFADVAAINGGDGNRLCSTLVVNGDGALGSGTVKMTSGATVYQTRISGDGFAVFNLFDATWTALATSGRNTQDTIPQTFVVTAAFKDTITMTAFSPSSPSDTGRVVLYVWTDNILGDTLAGATFRVIPVDKGKNWVTGENKIILTGEASKKTNANGYAEIEVYQSSFVRPYPTGNDSLKYNISITYPGLGEWHQFYFVAPDSGDQYEIGVRE